MHRLAIAALLASFAFFSPGIASARVVGVVAVGYENTQTNYDNNYCECYLENSEDGPNISAALVGPLHGDDGPWIIEGEGRLQSEKEDYGYGYQSHDNVGHAAVHVAYRTDDYAVGAFYGIQNDHGSDVQEIGIEAQKYFSNITLQGSLGYGRHNDSCSGCNDDSSVWNAQANATYYFNDSWSASVGVGYAAFDYTGGSTDLTTVGVSGEYRIPDSNYSVRAAYTHGDANDTYGDYSTDTFQVAFVVDLGSANARERDQRGPSFQGADALDLHYRLWEDAGY